MMGQSQRPTGTLSPGMLAAMIVVVALLLLSQMVGSLQAMMLAAWVALSDGSLGVLIFVAAGGMAYYPLRRLAGPSAPAPLVLVTACGAGLWLLSALMLIVGTFVPGGMSQWVWWPVVGAGVLAAAWQGRTKLRAWQVTDRDGRALIWLVLAAAAAMWIAGATQPPGFIGRLSGDSYDVLEYHLQVPREFYNNGHIGPLYHNCYSFFPLGNEMLFLLGMCLRGGAYNGMYLATMMHGLFGVLTVAAIFLSLRDSNGAAGGDSGIGKLPSDEAGQGGPHPAGDLRARFSIALLATSPVVISLAWLAVDELSELCYLVLALLWLRVWLRQSTWRMALPIGLMLGAACCDKYLSVGLVAGPVAVVMLIACLWKGRDGRAVVAAGGSSSDDGAACPPRSQGSGRLGQTLLAGVAALVLLSPWLVRNFAYTHNPLFPLCTTIFGRGHWSPQQQQRWIDGHGPEKKPPVPTPEGWQMPPVAGRAEMFVHHFLTEEFGYITLLLAAVGVCVLAASRRPDAWEWSLAALVAGDLAVWTFFTHEMPGRFLVPALGPICLLAGGVLEKLAQVSRNPFTGTTPKGTGGPWGRAPALVLLVAGVLVNLLVLFGMFAEDTRGQAYPPMPGEVVSNQVMGAWLSELPMPDANSPNSRFVLPSPLKILLVGESTPFYYPPGTVYATAFDSHPLAAMVERGLAAPEVLAGLQKMGVTHLVFNWEEIYRLAGTYGLAAPLSSEVYQQGQALVAEASKAPPAEREKMLDQLQRQHPPAPKVYKELQALGARAVEPYFFTHPQPRPSTQPAATGPASPATQASGPTTQPAVQPNPWMIRGVLELPKP